MAWKLAEGLVDEVDAYMKAKLPAKLDALDAEYGDFILDDPAAYEVSEKALESIAKWPVLITLAETTRVPQWSGGKIWGHHDLTIGVLVLDQNLTRLRRRLYRYGRAVFEVMEAAHNDVAVTFQIGLGEASIEFSPIFSDRESRYISDVRVRMECVKEEAK